MDSLRAALWALLLAAPAPSAFAGVAWVCGLSDAGTRLFCVADVDPAAPDTGSHDTPTAVVNGTRFPLDARRIYSVDLWSPPTEPDFVRLLATATICYRSPGCQVTVSPGPWMTVAHPTQANAPALARR